MCALDNKDLASLEIALLLGSCFMEDAIAMTEDEGLKFILGLPEMVAAPDGELCRALIREHPNLQARLREALGDE